MESALDFATPTFKADPFPPFAQLRLHDPVHEITMPNGRKGWMITRYEDVDAVLRDGRFVKDIRNIYSTEELARTLPKESLDILARGLNQSMVASDVPDHTRLRSLMNLSFTPRLIEQWRERVQAIIDELLDTVQEKGEMELIEDFAYRLPMMVITEMLGIPAADHEKFHAWTNVFVESQGSAEAPEKMGSVIPQFHGYLVTLLQEKRKHPADDLLSRMIQSEAEGKKLTEKEIVAMIFLFLIAGHETTTNLIGNSILALLLHPDQMEKLRQDPALIKTAIEEFLRYQGSLMTATARFAREDIEWKGKLIRRGDEMVVVLASANRDPEAFTAPDELDITRQERQHLAFGKGIHYCLGAPLARMEGQLAINALLRRMPNLRLNADVHTLVWRSGTFVMGLNALPLAF
jgi:cytochrome P450